MYSLEDIRRVQLRLLEMAVAIRDVLENHDVPHMITYGTLLGAVRHKGFIPWDDDFDFYIISEEYDDVIEYLRKELPANYTFMVGLMPKILEQRLTVSCSHKTTFMHIMAFV